MLSNRAMPLTLQSNLPTLCKEFSGCPKNKLHIIFLRTPLFVSTLLWSAEVWCWRACTVPTESADCLPFLLLGYVLSAYLPNERNFTLFEHNASPCLALPLKHNNLKLTEINTITLHSKVRVPGFMDVTLLRRYLVWVTNMLCLRYSRAYLLRSCQPYFNNLGGSESFSWLDRFFIKLKGLLVQHKAFYIAFKWISLHSLTFLILSVFIFPII